MTTDQASARFIRPVWPASAGVAAVTTTRISPVPAIASGKPYDSFNLATHVGDDPIQVQRNRTLLQQALQLPSEPLWLRQIHGDRAVEFEEAGNGIEADAIIARKPGEICLVQTADCLPVLICDRQGECVAAVHGGWRGLCQNIIAKTIEALNVPPGNLLAWLGPAISGAAYEVDDTVRRHFADKSTTYAQAFKASGPGHWQLDLYTIARLQLRALGVTAIYGGDFCTYRQSDLFYSYRRDGETGRMASLIWLR
jgi:YfiH family protein